MVLAIAEGEDGRTILVIGLSHGNLDRLRADGTKGYIKIDGKSKNLPIDIIQRRPPHRPHQAHRSRVLAPWMDANSGTGYSGKFMPGIFPGVVVEAVAAADEIG